ncbi:protein-disulfide reductase DsbD [Lonepinella sp. BR2904]|uniref:protein-disulfide reductase DsbD n=1 Tax=Lonepinella sp. BR2904 TaxID=3434551 RepID=UPI003F6DC35F
MKKYLTFFILLLISISSQGNLFSNKTSFLPADQAFQFSAQNKNNQLVLHWLIADDYYLYKNEITATIENGKLGELQFPQGEVHQDEFFGETEIFRHELRVILPVLESHELTQLIVTYQGCTKGLCYPPEEKIIDLASFHFDLEKSAVKNTAVFQHISEQDQLADSLFKSQYAVLGFFLLGLGLAFTPCVLPMLPLLSAIVIGQHERPSMWRALGLSFIYVQGMALTYTLLGLIVAAIGLPFQQALQSPPVLVGLSVLFVLLSLSMFGVFTLQLPIGLQTKISQISQKQQSGAYFGVFVMGALAGLVASPCTTAPLSGALLYVAQTGDLFIGAITLYLLALGMGVPLILVTVFGNQILPKSGDWLNTIKQLFGFILLLLPVILLERVFVQWTLELWAVWLITFTCWIAHKRYWLGVIVALLMFFVIQHFNLLSYYVVNEQSAVQKRANFKPQFMQVSTLSELEQTLKNNPKSVAMLDLYADWCIACKEFEKYTFSDATVMQDFEKILLLQIDMTQNSPENQKLMEKLKVLGLPTILFFNQQGQEISGSRVTGFMPADKFHQWLLNLIFNNNEKVF